MAVIELSQTPAPFPQPQPQPQTAYVASGEAMGAADAWGDQFTLGMVAIGAAALLLFSMMRR